MFHTKKEKGLSSRYHRFIGRAGLSAEALDSEPDEVAAHIRAFAGEIRGDKEIVAYYKRSFEYGLGRLVSSGHYHRRILSHLSVMGMLPLFENSDCVKDGLLGYSSPGIHERLVRDPRAQSLRGAAGVGSLNREVKGNYLVVGDYSDEPTAMHEVGHRAVLIGTKGEPHILRERLTNWVTMDVMNAAGMDPSSLAQDYPQHGRVFGMTVNAANLTPRELSYVVSGPDSEANDRLLRHVVTERVGWDAIGFAQGQYTKNLRRDINPTGDVNHAASVVADLLNEEFQYRGGL